MAGGPLFPVSAYPVTAGNVFPNIFTGTGTSLHEEGLGVAASIAADSTWRLRFHMPPTLPTGTLKLRLLALAAATSGAARVDPNWASVAVGVSPSGATLSAEGVTPDSTAGQAGVGDTLTWGTGDTNQYVEAKWILNAATAPAASEVVVMDIIFRTASWTLAVVSTWIASLVWE